MKLNEKLIKLRKEKGLSQEEFGNEINVSRQAVSKWENEETKPDIDKIQEIVKKFGVTYEYLLNDEIIESKTTTNIKKESKKNSILKVILIIFLVYLLICIYRFIGLYKFYSIANSFSEKNYWMYNDFQFSSEFDGNSEVGFDTEKIGDVLIKKFYFYDTDNDIKNETFPSSIEYTDFEKKIAYRLDYDEETGKYIYSDRVKEALNDEEKENLFNDKDKNLVKENTFVYIPHNFKDMLLMAINPRTSVSMIKREINGFDFMNDVKIKIKLSSDYIVENVKYKTQDSISSQNFSYDYVPGHFENKDRLKDPLESYKDMILYEEEN